MVNDNQPISFKKISRLFVLAVYNPNSKILNPKSILSKGIGAMELLKFFRKSESFHNVKILASSEEFVGGSADWLPKSPINAHTALILRAL